MKFSQPQNTNNMANFKPQVTIITSETRREYANSFGTKNPYKTISYPTYKDLLKNIKRHLEENLEDTVSVSRSKRGEWGEWFEIWKLNWLNKPEIIKQGWM